MRSLRTARTRAWFILTLISVLAALLPTPAQTQTFRVLVFSRTLGHRHTSVPLAVAAIRQMGAQGGFGVDATEDPGVFTDAGLAPYSAVVFALTTLDVLDVDQQAAFERFIESGRGFAGIHSASDTEYDWSWYMGLVGAYYVSHSGGKQATIKVADRQHRSTRHLPTSWSVFDEWYNFNLQPRGRTHVLMSLDESTYTGGWMGPDHPISWCHGFDGGRSWYTGLGHVDQLWSDRSFLDHVAGGIIYAAQGDAKSECGGTDWNTYDQTPIAAGVQPTSVAPAADGRVFFSERGGALKVWSPTGGTVLAGTVSVSGTSDGGLSSVALDPGFPTNGHIYLAYVDPSMVLKVSRFRVTGDQLEAGSEVVMLSFPVDATCCNNTAKIRFAPDGTMLISTGDGTAPDPQGYAPIDEREGRSFADAQRTAANSNSFQGKVLRITPRADGGYDVPDGNLFPRDGTSGKPEIFAMGLRDPSPVAGNPSAGPVFVADRGPSAAVDSTTRGPRGYEEINRLTGADNLGWPYCIERNRPYIDHDFALGVSGAPFDCSAPTNGSPNNTGRAQLPPASGSFAAYANDQDVSWGKGARGIVLGPLYRSVATSPSSLPSYFDDALFVADNSRGWIKEVRFDGAGRILAVHPFLETSSRSITDLAQGPDGALYLVDLGPEPSNPSTPGAAIVRIATNRSQDAPVAIVDNTGVWAGSAPFTITLSGEGSHDPDGDALSYAWDLNGDGTFDRTGMKTTHTYPQGFHKATLKVTDATGRSSFAFVNIRSGAWASDPVVVIKDSSPTSGPAPLTVSFSSAGSYEPDNDPMVYEWDFESDGVVDSRVPNPTHTYPAGRYIARLRLVDRTGRSASATMEIISGNSRANIVFDPSRTIYRNGEPVSYAVAVTDAEDGSTASGSISCSEVTVRSAIAHDGHIHQIQEDRGCSGTITPTAAGHDPNRDSLLLTFTASYTDRGGAGYGPLAAAGSHSLHPARKQAEAYSGSYGIVRQTIPSGQVVVGAIQNGDFIVIRNLDLTGITRVSFRAATWFTGGIIEVRTGSVSGPIIGRAVIAQTSSSSPYVYRGFTVPITDPQGAREVYLVFKSFIPPGQTPVSDPSPELFTLDWIDLLRDQDPLPSLL